MDKGIPIVNPPKWLMSESFEFNIENIINDSLFFPYCELCKKPLVDFKGKVHSFVFTDYLFSPEIFREEFTQRLIDGFTPIHHQLIEYDAFKNEVDEQSGGFWHHFDASYHQFASKIQEAGVDKFLVPFFCDWVIYQNDTGERFSLLYLAADAISVFRRLYIMQDTVPKVLVLFKENHLPLYWTKIIDENDIFYQYITGKFDNRPEINFAPEYLAVNEALRNWRIFSEHVCILGEFSVWSKDQKVSQ